MDALKQGFRDIFPLEMIQVFDEKEVEVPLFVVQRDRNEWFDHFS